MKLKQIYEYSGHSASLDGYVEYLKDKGHSIPRVKGKKGYVLFTFDPDEQKTFPTNSEAKNKAPRHQQKHWMVVNGKTGAIENVPEWWLATHHISGVQRGNH